VKLFILILILLISPTFAGEKPRTDEKKQPRIRLKGSADLQKLNLDFSGSRAGNGGEFDVEQPWVQYAKKLRDLLERIPVEQRMGFDPNKFWDAVSSTYLLTATEITVTAPDKRIAVKDARHDEINGTHIITINPNWFSKASIIKIFGAQLHEYAQVLELEIDSYEVSAPLLSRLTQLYWEDHKSGAQTLFDEEYETSKTGMDFKEALKICKAYKKVFHQKYFLVYCSFFENNWKEIKIGQGYYKDYRFFGYQHIHQNNQVGMWGLYMAQSSTIHRPVVKAVYIPYSYTYEVPLKIYGLRIFGWGRMDSDVPYKIVLNGTDIDGSGSGVSFDYESKFKALLACKKALGEGVNSLDFKYYRAQCYAPDEKLPNGKYSFVIRSKSPFLPD